MKQNLRNNHNFFILVIGQIISLFGSAIQRFALSLYLLDITGSATIFSSILALSMIPVVVVAPFAGVIADRADKKKVMVILDFLSAIFISLYAVTLFQGNITYMYVGILMVALSVFSTIYQPTVNASIQPCNSNGEGCR